METALIYNGSPIGERDEMLSLTDLWRAAGSPESKRPSDWTVTAQCKEFAEFIAGNSGIELFQTVRGGQEPGTWSHWQLAYAYAKYLSPEVHAWFNTVARAHMEGRGLPVQAIQGAITISEEQLERFADRVGAGAARVTQQLIVEDRRHNVDPRFDRIEDQMRGYHQENESRFRALEVGQKKGKAQPSEATLAEHNWVNFQLGGRCPCCAENSVCNPDGTRADKTHFDHYTEVDKPIPENSWIVCRDCNLKKLPKQRVECKDSFGSYQKRRRDRVERDSTPLLFWHRSS